MLRSKEEMAAVFHREASLTVKKNKKSWSFFCSSLFSGADPVLCLEALCGLLGFILTEKILPVHD